jgi:1-acyl-sn-glycerol-3-phosphate acyltransferase
VTPGPRLAHDGPPTPWLLYWVGRAWMALAGWTVEGSVPGPKGVIIGAPHTSNWDGVFLLAAGWIFRVKLSWVGKHTLFRFPFGGLLRALGGIPIDRGAPQGLVGQLTERFAATERLFVTIPPEGTRRFVPYWKSGFYWVAREANVPIVLGFLDYGRKVAGLGPTLHPTGDVRADMDRIRAFYEGIEGYHRDQRGRIRLQVEDEPDPPPPDPPPPDPPGP